MKKKIVDKDGFHIPVKSEQSYAEEMPGLSEQLPREDAATAQRKEEKTNDSAAAERKPVGKEEVAAMRQKLRDYITSKKPYDEKYKNNFDTYTLLYNENNVIGSGKDRVELIKKRRGAQTLNVIMNKHADAMDNYPEAICLPRARDDEETAKRLNGVIPCVLERNRFYRTYDNLATDKYVGGASARSVTWDSDAQGGLGEVCIRRENVLNLFWEPFVENIQDSEYFFNVRICSVEEAKRTYPQLKEAAPDDLGLTEFKTYDNQSHNYDKAAVIDCYYKKGGLVHLCKFCGETLIDATENDAESYPDGLYVDGLYPFIITPCFAMRDTPVGFSFIDVCRAPQDYLDELKRDLLKNVKVNSATRNLVRHDAGINNDDLVDLDNEMIDVDGNMSLDQIIRPLETKDIAAGSLSVYNALIDEMKETTGTNDASNGASAAGVTSGNAIAALQEAGGKISRDINKMEFFAFTEMVTMIIERMRQFYTPGRVFRIVGENKETEYIEFDGAALNKQPIEVEGSDGEFWRLPVFDIQVKAQRSSPFTTAANNQMMMDMFNMGMFNADRADAALVALEGMSFEGKEKIMELIRQNKTLLDAVNEMSGKLQMMTGALAQQEAQNAAMEEMPQFPVNAPYKAML